MTAIKDKNKYVFSQIKPSASNLFFWQPKFDLIKWLIAWEYGNMAMVLVNYLIWFFLLFISYLLVARSTNVFWQILLAVIVGELVEKFGKNIRLWRRPLYLKNDQAPPGMIERWYETGSFPSGHTIKAVFFFLFILQYQVFNPVVYVLIVLPLLLFRILAGFHYPIDVLGGAIFGYIIWLISKSITFPRIMLDLIQSIYNFVFLVH